MKNLILFILVLLFGQQFAKSQNHIVKSNTDLPVINYATSMLKTGDTASMHLWMKNLAASELKLPIVY